MSTKNSILRNYNEKPEPPPRLESPSVADGANTQITDDSSLYDDLDDLHSHQPTESHESNTPVTENHHRTVKHITCRKIMFALLALVLMTAAGAYLTWEVKRMMKPGDVKNPKEQLIKSSTDTPITDYKPAVTSTVTKHMEISSYEYKKQTVVKPTTAKIQTTPPSYTTTTVNLTDESCDMIFRKNCYTIAAEDLDYQKAEQACKDNNSKLVHFDGLDEFDFIQNYLNQNYKDHDFWLKRWNFHNLRWVPGKKTAMRGAFCQYMSADKQHLVDTVSYAWCFKHPIFKMKKKMSICETQLE